MFYSPDIVCDLVCFVLCFACHSAVCFFSSVSRSIFGFLCSSNSFSDRIKWLLSIILFCFLSHDLMLKRIESVLASIISRAYEQNAYILFLIVRCTNAFPMVFLTRADALVSVCIFYHFIVVVFFRWHCPMRMQMYGRFHRLTNEWQRWKPKHISRIDNDVRNKCL